MAKVYSEGTVQQGVAVGRAGVGKKRCDNRGRYQPPIGGGDGHAHVAPVKDDNQRSNERQADDPGHQRSALVP